MISVRRIGLRCVALALFATSAAAQEPLFTMPSEALGEAYLEPGHPPPRSNYLLTPFDSLLPSADLWPRIVACNRLAIVGLKLTNLNRGYFRGDVLVPQNQIPLLKDQVISRTPGVRDASAPGTGFFDPRGRFGEPLPVLALELTDDRSLDALRADSNVDYVEPLCTNGLIYFDSGSAGGCTGETLPTPLAVSQ